MEKLQEDQNKNNFLNGNPESAPDSAKDGAATGTVQLKREVGLVRGVAIVIGSIIGSGIFVAPKGILVGSGSVGMSLVIWVICALVSMLAALCYAELGAVLPRSGGTYMYIHRAYGDLSGFIVAWTLTLIVTPSSVSLVSLTFGSYVADYVSPGVCPPPTVLVKLFAILAVMLVMFINCVSVRLASGLPVLFSTGKVIALVIIIVIGAVKLFQGHTQYLDPSVSFEGTSADVFGYGVAFYNGLWAYSGWDILNMLPEEMNNPRRDVPLAVFIAVPFITVIYLLTNIAYFTVMSPEELLASGAVAVTFAERTLGYAAFLIPLGVCISTSGTLIGSFLSGSRITFAAGREGHMLSLVSMVNLRRLTPLPAVILQGCIAIVLNLIGDFNSIVIINGFVAWLFYGATFVSVLVFRRKYPDKLRPFKVHLLVPIVATIMSIFMVVLPLLSNPTAEYLYVFVILFLGLIVYFVFIKWKRRLPGMDKINLFLQKLFLISPSPYYVEDKQL